MNLRHVVSCGIFCAALALAGCDKGRQDPSNVTVRVANVAPGFAELQFRREQVDPRALGYKNAQEFSWDEDTYDFFVDERSLITNVTGRSWTFSRQLQADHGYTLALTEVAGEVQPVVLEFPAAPTADAQIVALHAAHGSPAMDLYLERPGAGIATATPRGTFGAQQQIAPRTLAGGDYELWLTAAGNRANVLLATATINLTAGATTTFIVMPDPGVGGAQLSVLMIQASPAVLYDRNALSELRVINAADDGMPRDFVLNSQFSPPLFPAVPYADPTPFAQIPAGVQAVNVTPGGNPGALEIDSALTPSVAQRNTLLFTGPAGTLTFTINVDDGRRIHNEAKLSFMNAASQFSLVDFVVVTRGSDPTGVLALATLGTPSTTIGYNPVPPGDYDLYLRETTTGSLLSGPTPISLAATGIYSVLATNGPDTATATPVLFDDFP